MPDWYRVRIDEVQFECWTLVDARVYVCRIRRCFRKARLHALTTDTGLRASDPSGKACTLPICHLPSFMSCIQKSDVT